MPEYLQPLLKQRLKKGKEKEIKEKKER